MSPAALIGHGCALVLLLLALVIGKPVLCAVALAIEVGHAALSGTTKQ
ncbi:hypothetical protein ACQ859_18285 [Roseateles chitinivorans]